MFHTGTYKEANLSPDKDFFFGGKIECAPFSFYAHRIIITYSKNSCSKTNNVFKILPSLDTFIRICVNITANRIIPFFEKCTPMYPKMYAFFKNVYARQQKYP
jgi:hypothetical protein